jgi:DASH complex subunit SPC19
LIPQPTLAAAEASLRDEMGPFISVLLERAEQQLLRQGRRIETLKARSDLNAGRLSAAPGDFSSSSSAAAKSRGASGRNVGLAKKPLGGEAALRAKVLRQKKEALKYSVERLEMEVMQKERELRVRLEKA